jgi:iron-sulfur cluster assembly accessory protein
MNFTITDRAASKIAELVGEQRPLVRVAVEGGGCGGLQYAIAIDDQPADDDVLVASENGEAEVVIDPFSAPFLNGGTLDFLDGLQESGFKVDNPNAVSSCGCGQSFRVDDDSCPSGT